MNKLTKVSFALLSIVGAHCFYQPNAFGKAKSEKTNKVTASSAAARDSSSGGSAEMAKRLVNERLAKLFALEYESDRMNEDQLRPRQFDLLFTTFNITPIWTRVNHRFAHALSTEPPQVSEQLQVIVADRARQQVWYALKRPRREFKEAVSSPMAQWYIKGSKYEPLINRLSSTPASFAILSAVPAKCNDATACVATRFMVEVEVYPELKEIAGNTETKVLLEVSFKDGEMWVDDIKASGISLFSLVDDDMVSLAPRQIIAGYARMNKLSADGLNQIASEIAMARTRQKNPLEKIEN